MKIEIKKGTCTDIRTSEKTELFEIHLIDKTGCQAFAFEKSGHAIDFLKNAILVLSTDDEEYKQVNLDGTMEK